MQNKIEQTEDDQRDAFNRELASRLASLDRGEHLDPKFVRECLREKSRRRSNRILQRYDDPSNG